MKKGECILVFRLASFMLTILCSVPFVDNKKLLLSKFYSVMDSNDDLEEDHLTSYDIQLSIQESIEASKTVFYPER